MPRFKFDNGLSEESRSVLNSLSVLICDNISWEISARQRSRIDDGDSDYYKGLALFYESQVKILRELRVDFENCITAKPRPDYKESL